MRALRDGVLFLLTGLLYLTPIMPLLSKFLIADAVLNFLGIIPAADSRAALAIRVLGSTALALFIGLIVVGLHVGGVRHALGERKGLIEATGNARLLLKHRAISGRLLLNVVLIGLVGLVAVSLGAALLLLPGFYLLVVCSLASWYLFACYRIAVGIHEPGAIPKGNLGHGWLRVLRRRLAPATHGDSTER